MTSPSPSALPQSPHGNRDQRWSKPERAIARKAFEHALHQELQHTIQHAKQMAAAVKQPSELWDLEDHLRQRRKEIDSKYDYRESNFTFLFGRLLHERRITEEQLRGLSDDHLQAIRSVAAFVTSMEERD